jgi:bifunctional non-homologous end joining protein LigD
MLASLRDAPLTDPQFVYEPKYDGIRAIAEISAGDKGRVRLWSRVGNDKAAQFPKIASALESWARSLKGPLVLDGEIVALDAHGSPAGFQDLQRSKGQKVAFMAFDLLRDGAHDLRERPLLERRAALERLFKHMKVRGGGILRISEMVRGDGRPLYERALREGWEGLIAKRADSRYQSGARTPDWCKLKIVHEQEFVIGGYTEPRQSRADFGALLLGVYEKDRLVYAGHAGTGFDGRELARVMKRMKPLEIKKSPFDTEPRTNEKAHWVKPALVAQIKFTEWTADGRLRHPVYLGLRDDRKPHDVRRETVARVPGSTFQVPGSSVKVRRSTNPEQRTRNEEHGTENTSDQLTALESARRDGLIHLPNGETIAVTNLHKPFWPKLKLTKGDLFRYYVQAAPFILPAIADRPLVMKRFPNGVAGQPFYQHRAPEPPAGVRVEMVRAAEQRPQIVGGTLLTLLYTTQLAAISQDPWFSRVQSPSFADHVALDLDPAPGVSFKRVLEVAKWIAEELDSLGAVSFPKTSGADGLHIYLPLPPKTPYEAGLLFCQIIATVVAHKHPKAATIERRLAARGTRVYVDYLQNSLGKTLASAYSARASDYAGVSTPLTWKEINEGVRREDFTIMSLPARLKSVGDLWRGLRQAKGVDLSRAARY